MRRIFFTEGHSAGSQPTVISTVSGRGTTVFVCANAVVHPASEPSETMPTATVRRSLFGCPGLHPPTDSGKHEILDPAPLLSNDLVMTDDTPRSRRTFLK